MADRKPDEELYDLQKDPDEIHNLAGAKEIDPIRARLRSALEEWMKECDDRPEKHGAMRQ